jgi:EAL domain-containing protein (putative c-di-GMP-specific phosphodiesterase class I)/CheY-like chemotaxis protein
MKQFAAPFDLNGNEAFVTASIGISVFPADSRDVDALIKGAHTAMYGAKEHGRNTFRYYTAEMNALVSKRLQLETRLRRAVERQEFALHYQPKVRATSGEVVGLEALLRWQPPDGDGAPPAEFIPILEETGLIVQVGEWVVDAACAQISAWRRAGIQPLPVAINISGCQFRQAGLDKTIAQKLAQFGIGPRWLEIEITESSLMENPDEAVAMLNNLKALGITISVDDFGTGYSSLSYLKRFPLDTLKIDRSFVRDIMVNADDAAIARAIVSMAHSLNLKVVAEGVETVEQLGFLRANRCDQIQGYLFSKPLAADACSALLASARRLGPPAEIGDVEDVPALLLVDDDRDSLELLRCMLEKDGYRILTASSADDALALLARHRVGVVVSDQDMPGLSGVEFFKRSKLMYPEVARIMLTGYDDYTLAATAINEAGVCKLFLKDRDDHLLSSEIRKAFWRQDPDVGPHSARDLLTTVLT